MDCSPPGSSFMEFSRQEYRSVLSCPLRGDLPDPGEPGLLHLLHCRTILYHWVTGEDLSWQGQDWVSWNVDCGFPFVLCVCMCVCVLVAQSCPTLCDCMEYSPPGFSVLGIFRQEYWSGLPWPPPGDLPNPGIELRSSCIVGKLFTIWATRETLAIIYLYACTYIIHIYTYLHTHIHTYIIEIIVCAVIIIPYSYNSTHIKIIISPKW